MSPSCVHCDFELKVSSPIHIETSTCPNCGKHLLLRGRTKHGGFVYFQGATFGFCDQILDPREWSPDELEAIARDLRLQEAKGALKFDDGSGPSKARRAGAT